MKNLTYWQMELDITTVGKINKLFCIVAIHTKEQYETFSQTGMSQWLIL